jgi:iron complex outermembrane receptor protein
MMSKIITLILSLAILHGARAQVHTLSGTVTGDGGRPLAGAAVYLLNTPLATTTDTEGSFRLSPIFAGRYTLRVTATGYADLHREVETAGVQSDVRIALERPYKRLDAVVVSAQKIEEGLQRLPLSVTALTARRVEEYRLWHARELTAVAPNLYSADPGDNRNITSARGIVSTSYDPAVATYIDGVNQFNLDTYIPHLFDVERVEVLRGPQGTLYGRNAMGGVINIITRQPANKVEGFAEAGIGNRGQQRFSAGVRLPLVKDKLFFGAAGLYDRREGYYTNEFNHTDYDRQRNVVGNYYLRFLRAATWSFTLNAKYHYNRNKGPFSLVFGADEALARPYKLNQNAVTQMSDNTVNTSLSIRHTAKPFTISSHTAYQSNYRYYTDPIDADFSPLDAISIINNYGDRWNKVEVLTQELGIRSPAGSTSALQWSAGAYLFHQRNPVKQATRFGEDAEQMGAPDKNFSLINTTLAEGSGIAAYGELGYSFTEQLQLTGGLRYDREEKEQQVLGEYQKDPDPVPQFAFRPDTSARASFSAFSPRVSLSFRPTADRALYLSWSRGFRAGGLTPLSSDPSQPPLHAFRPEYSNNIEAGSKNLWWDNRLLLNLAVFYTTLTNAQVPTLVLPDAVTITRNTGRLRSRAWRLSCVPCRSMAWQWITASAIPMPVTKN